MTYDSGVTSENALRPWLDGERQIDGFCARRALNAFGGNADLLIKVLRSYIVSTRMILAKLIPFSRESLKDYMIAVHSLKGSNYAICADKAGKMAELLEKAAYEGDCEFIEDNNLRFAESVENLILGLDGILKFKDIICEKSALDAPDAQVLKRLRNACANYDISGINSAMEELERFAYRTQSDLVPWLSEQVLVLDFNPILDRLSVY
jgi:hypothetical protein